MFPMFNDDDRRRRRMNLGGANSVASHDQIVGNARQVREQRALLRQKEECALLVQSCWRGYLGRERLRKELEERFDEAVESVDGLRCLCWLKGDRGRLGVWAGRVVGRTQLGERLLLSETCSLIRLGCS